MPCRPGGVRHDVRDRAGHRVRAHLLLGRDVVVLDGHALVHGGHDATRRNSVRRRRSSLQQRELHVSSGQLLPLRNVPGLHGRVRVSPALDR